MKSVLALLLAAFATAPAAAAVTYTYEGTPERCRTYGEAPCVGDTMYAELYLNDDGTLDRAVFGVRGSYGLTIDATGLLSRQPSWTNAVSRDDDWWALTQHIYRDYWRCSDGSTGTGDTMPDDWETMGCSPAMPASYGLSFHFDDPLNWSASYWPMDWVTMSVGYIDMGKDMLWDTRGVMQLVGTSKVPEPTVAVLLLAGLASLGRTYRKRPRPAAE